MEQDHHITLTGKATTPADVCRWFQALFRLHARLAPRFARPEPCRRAWSFGRQREITRFTWRSRQSAAQPLR
jgi:hypothetical protein